MKIKKLIEELKKIDGEKDIVIATAPSGCDAREIERIEKQRDGDYILLLEDY